MCVVFIIVFRKSVVCKVVISFSFALFVSYVVVSLSYDIVFLVVNGNLIVNFMVKYVSDIDVVVVYVC